MNVCIVNFMIIFVLLAAAAQQNCMGDQYPQPVKRIVRKTIHHINNGEDGAESDSKTTNGGTIVHSKIIKRIIKRKPKVNNNVIKTYKTYYSSAGGGSASKSGYSNWAANSETDGSGGGTKTITRRIIKKITRRNGQGGFTEVDEEPITSHVSTYQTSHKTGKDSSDKDEDGNSVIINKSYLINGRKVQKDTDGGLTQTFEYENDYGNNGQSTKSKPKKFIKHINILNEEHEKLDDGKDYNRANKMIIRDSEGPTSLIENEDQLETEVRQNVQKETNELIEWTVNEWENKMSGLQCGGPGWHQFDGFCYKIIRDRMNWQQAQSACEKENSNLTSIHSQQENEFISALAQGMTTADGAESGFWIGMTRKPSGTGNFNCVWSDKTVTTFGNQPLPHGSTYPWRPGQPDNYGRTEECIYMYSPYQPNGITKSSMNSLWNDFGCHVVQIGGVCKKRSKCVK